MRIRARLLAAVTAALVVAGCSGDAVKIAALPPSAGYERLGRVEGTGCGSLGIAGTAYYFIPMVLGSRVERAYEKALEQRPGATGLVNVKVTEYWFWWVVATTRCTTISGEAIK